MQKSVTERRQNNVMRNTYTGSGEVATKREKAIDAKAVEDEEALHGFYAVATNLDKTINEVLEINGNRWMIEYCFRILKSFFETRPMFVFTEDHIKGHLTICYEALLVFQILSLKLKKAGAAYPARAILDTLKNMMVSDHNGQYYEADYTNSKVLQSLEGLFDLKLDRAKYRIKTFKQK